MKKIISLLIIISIILTVYGCTIYKKKQNILVVPEENISHIYDLNFYGKFFHISGKVNTTEVQNINLYIYSNDKSYSYELNYEIGEEYTRFSTGDILNKGIILDNVSVGEYTFYLEVINGEEKKLFHLENDTNYSNTTYYTVSLEDKKINISNKKK